MRSRRFSSTIDPFSTVQWRVSRSTLPGAGARWFPVSCDDGEVSGDFLRCVGPRHLRLIDSTAAAGGGTAAAAAAAAVGGEDA